MMSMGFSSRAWIIKSETKPYDYFRLKYSLENLKSNSYSLPSHNNFCTCKIIIMLRIRNDTNT